MLALAGAIVGLLWGLAADRVSARWPAHDDGEIRPVDWRTVAVAVFGGLAGWLVALRSSDLTGPAGPAEVGLVAVVAADLVVLFATDLDQRLLPHVLTLPLGPLALAAFVLGVEPFVRSPGELAIAAGAAILLPLGMFALSVPFGRGAIGMGDLTMLFGIGLLGGASRLLGAAVVGALVAALVIVALIAARRITLKSYVPYGPFLILGVTWALLVLPLDAPM